MTVPSHFQERLDEVFHGRFRIRWSDKRSQYVLEQKVHTGQALEPPPVNPLESVTQTERYDTYDDAWIRIRDGYFLVMHITHGDRMGCPVCGATLRVPVYETGEVRCENCIRAGLDGRYIACHFELNDRLIEYIRELDPLTDGPARTYARMKARRQDRALREAREHWDQADYRVGRFDKTQVEGNAMVGYGQKSRDLSEGQLRLE